MYNHNQNQTLWCCYVQKFAKTVDSERKNSIEELILKSTALFTNILEAMLLWKRLSKGLVLFNMIILSFELLEISRSINLPIIFLLETRTFHRNN